MCVCVCAKRVDDMVQLGPVYYNNPLTINVVSRGVHVIFTRQSTAANQPAAATNDENTLVSCRFAVVAAAAAVVRSFGQSSTTQRQHSSIFVLLLLFRNFFFTHFEVYMGNDRRR